MTSAMERPVLSMVIDREIGALFAQCGLDPERQRAVILSGIGARGALRRRRKHQHAELTGGKCCFEARQRAGGRGKVARRVRRQGFRTCGERKQQQKCGQPCRGDHGDRPPG